MARICFFYAYKVTKYYDNVVFSTKTLAKCGVMCYTIMVGRIKKNARVCTESDKKRRGLTKKNKL